jgi:hypothetical protein
MQLKVDQISSSVRYLVFITLSQTPKIQNNNSFLAMGGIILPF